jgi:hypothetical protein
VEENFRRLLEDLPLGVRIVTVEGETLYAKKAIPDIYGYNISMSYAKMYYGMVSRKMIFLSKPGYWP